MQKINLDIRKYLFTCLTLVGLLVVSTQLVFAQSRSLEYPKYEVDIEVNQDSTVDITETLSINFLGEYRGVFREITLNDPVRNSICIQNDVACGGFNFLQLLEVRDGDGNLIDPSKYELGIISNEDTGVEYFSIRWEVWPGGKVFSGDETFTWSFKYRVYGSLGYDGITPYLYWNAIPAGRGGHVDVGVVNIHFPSSLSPTVENVEVYFLSSRQYEYDFLGNTLTLEAANLSTFDGDMTVQYRLPSGSIPIPATLNYTSAFPWADPYVSLNGEELGQLNGEFKGLPVGAQELSFSYPGYDAHIEKLAVRPASNIELQFSLNPQPAMWFILILVLVCGGMGLILIPIGWFWVYRRWKIHGKDKGMPGAIIPIYHPPKAMHPYLLGSLKDEDVDPEDITGSIIDLAYRGYLKIKELQKGKNYELKLLKDKASTELTASEKQLLEGLFGSKDSVETKELAKTFAAKYKKLQSKIYEELVEQEYFTANPNTTRAKYYGLGVVTAVFGGILTFILFLPAIPLIGVPGPFTLGLALLLTGVAWLTVAHHMPAKTEKGGKVFGEILGFKMYLHHAERYRVQGLEPDEFEKYLSYAVVFGIEKEWAKKFEDIYKGQPDWYEGEGDVIWNAYWASRFMRTFANSMNSTAYTPIASSGSKGGGWSGGSFGGGGFSGGGGGGGFSGGF